MNNVVIIGAMLGGGLIGHLAHDAGIIPDLLTSGERVITESVPHKEIIDEPEEAQVTTAHYGLFQRVEDGPKGELIIKVPLPHTVPPGTAGSGLRLAMVHDILHQRYPIHGKAWFKGRVAYNQGKVDRIIKAKKKPDDRDLLRLDNTAVAHLRLHQDAEAEEIMRQKLTLMDTYEIDTKPTIPDLDVERYLSDWTYRNAMAQIANEERPFGGVDDVPSHRYTCYANLGTALIHQALKPAFAGDRSAIAKLAEGRAFILKAITHHPGAHGHREVWQMRAVSGLLAKLDDPSLWLKIDIMGNPLIRGSMIEHLQRVEHLQPFRGPRPYKLSWAQNVPRQEHSDAVYVLSKPHAAWAEHVVPQIRQHMMHLYFEEEYLPASDTIQGVPFDEPLMGVMGMWLQGGGANPHFALCIGQIMERIGQRNIAWSAYARALTMTKRFNGDPEIRQALADYCRERQDQILADWAAEGRPKSRDALQLHFEEELDFGDSWQRSLWAFEEGSEDLKKGWDPGDDSKISIAKFIRKHGKVASGDSSKDSVQLLVNPAGVNYYLNNLDEFEAQKYIQLRSPPPIQGSNIAEYTESGSRERIVYRAETRRVEIQPNTFLAHLPGIVLGAALLGFLVMLAQPKRPSSKDSSNS